MSTKHIEVVPYNPDWTHQFEDEAALIKQTLGEHCIVVHHIGSTSIPGLRAKNILDILCVVDALPEVIALEQAGYTYKGEYNIPLRAYFSKSAGNIKVNLHVVESDHGFIALNLSFRDYLRSHEEAREEYALLKETLLQDPASFERLEKRFTGYNLGKDEFIKGILDKAGFEGLTMNFCMHHREWEAYHRIRKEQIFALSDIQYDHNHPTITDPKHYHFVLYQGTTIIGVAHIEFLSDEDCALRPFAIDTPHQNQGFGALFLSIIEKWLKYRGKKIIRLHANPPAISFYKRLGYVFMPFQDHGPSIFEANVDMGKML